MILDKSREGIAYLLNDAWQFMSKNEKIKKKYAKDYFKLIDDIETSKALCGVFGIDINDKQAVKDLKDIFKEFEDEVKEKDKK